MIGSGKPSCEILLEIKSRTFLYIFFFCSLVQTNDTTGNATLSTTLNEDLKDTTVVSGLLDIVCILWVFRSKEISKAENQEYRAILEKKSGQILTLLFKYYKVRQGTKITLLERKLKRVVITRWSRFHWK